MEITPPKNSILLEQKELAILDKSVIKLKMRGIEPANFVYGISFSAKLPLNYKFW